MLKKNLLPFLLVAFLSALLVGETNIDITKAVNYSSQSTIVGGYISEDTTWTLDGSPYIVVEDVIVEPNVYLTIEPGVLVKFRAGTNLIVDGYLIAKGNSTHIIEFTSDSATPSPGNWGATRFRGVGQLLDWVSIKFASDGISIEDGEIIITNSLIVQNNIGVSIRGGSSITIQNSSISYNVGNGLYVEDWLPTTVMLNLERVNIAHNGGSGVSMAMRCIAQIRRSAIIKNHGMGILSYSGSFEHCYILDSTIAENSRHGLFQDEWSWTTWHIFGSVIANNSGAGIYREADGYPIYVENSTIKGNKNSGIMGHIGGYIYYSNIYANAPYDIRNMEANDVDAINNWWGTTDETLIREHIYDYYDDYNLGRVLFKPFLTAPAKVPDYIPPMTSHDYDGLWRNADFTITLRATDYESGIAETYYRINGGPVKALNVDGQPLITTESSNNTLEYWSVDNAGNEEFPHKILTGIKLDKTAPSIGVPSQMPESDIQPDQEVRVSVNVTDFMSDVKNVTLLYSLNNNDVWIDLPMTFNSTTGFYEAIIPGQQADTLLKYKITAYDIAENYKVEDNNGQYYVYTVIPEFSSTLLLLLTMILSILVIILVKSGKVARKPQGKRM